MVAATREIRIGRQLFDKAAFVQKYWKRLYQSETRTKTYRPCYDDHVMIWVREKFLDSTAARFCSVSFSYFEVLDFLLGMAPFFSLYTIPRENWRLATYQLPTNNIDVLVGILMD